MVARNLVFLYAAALLATYAAMRAGDMLYAFTPHFLRYAPAHALGGVAVGICALYLAAVFNVTPRLWHVLVLIALVGTAWEVWEYAIGAVVYPAEIFDLLSDYVADALGAVAAFFFFRSKTV